MRKIILVSLLFLISQFCFGQSLSRDVANEVKFEKLSFLDYAKGYRLVDGDWLEFDRKDTKYDEDFGFNSIPTKYFFFSDSGYGKSSISQSINFANITLIKAQYKGIDYLLIHFLRYSGKYKYPSIRKDWYEFKEDRYLVVDEFEFDMFRNTFPEKTNSAYRLKLAVLNDKTFRSDLDDFDEGKKIRLTLDNEPSSYLPQPQFLLDIFPIDHQGEKVVRFNYSVVGSYSETYNSFKAEVFDGHYFEAPWELFEALLKF